MIAARTLSAVALACMLAVACATAPPASPPADYSDYNEGTGDSGFIDYGDYGDYGDYSIPSSPGPLSSPRPSRSPAPAVECTDDDFMYYDLPLNSAPVAEFKVEGVANYTCVDPTSDSPVAVLGVLGELSDPATGSYAGYIYSEDDAKLGSVTILVVTDSSNMTQGTVTFSREIGAIEDAPSASDAPWSRRKVVAATGIFASEDFGFVLTNDTQGGYLEDFSACAPGDFSLPLVERVTLYGCTGPASSPRPSTDDDDN